MAVTNLTNTTWVFNSSIDLTTTGVTPVVEGDVLYKSITFTSNNRNYVQLRVGSTNGVSWNVFAYGYEGYSADDVYMSGYWTDEAFRTIEITGGADVTNASLIAWLEANATQQVVETLTIDLTTLENYSQLSSGVQYTIKTISRGTGVNTSSNMSTGVSYEK